MADRNAANVPPTHIPPGPRLRNRRCRMTSTTRTWRPFNVLMPAISDALNEGGTRRVSLASAVTAAAVIAATLVTVLFASLRVSPMDYWPPGRVIDVAAGALFVLAGAVLAHEPTQRVTALLLAVAGSCWLAASIRVPLSLSLSPPVPVPFLGEMAGNLFWIFAPWALLRYPERRLATRGEHVFLVVTVAWAGLGHAVLSLFYDPSWGPWPQPVWWPTVVADPDLYDRLWIVFGIVDSILALFYLTLVIRRLRRLGGVDRWVLAPMIASIFAVGILYPLGVIPPFADSQTLSMLFAVAMFAVPAALLAAVVRRRLTHTAVADIVVALATTNSGASVAANLRTALRDPTLQVLFWVEQSHRYVDEEGQPAPSPGEGRMVVPIQGHPEGRIGVVVADPALRRHQGLLDAAVGASGLALRNAKLQAELRARLDQVRASRKRIAEAGVTERRRIERDLHDGLQQRLLAVTLTLAQVRAATHDPAVLKVVEIMRSEMHAALQELRDVAHGVLPAMLAQGGLRPALDDIADRLPLNIELDVSPRRCPPSVETTAYFIACEALANVVKHAAAERANVRITTSDNELRLQVTDNGCGGADPTRGTGLAGLADRARAIGGELTVKTGPGGTLLQAVLPCE